MNDKLEQILEKHDVDEAHTRNTDGLSADLTAWSARREREAVRAALLRILGEGTRYIARLGYPGDKAYSQAIADELEQLNQPEGSK